MSKLVFWLVVCFRLYLPVLIYALFHPAPGGEPRTVQLTVSGIILLCLLPFVIFSVVKVFSAALSARESATPSPGEFWAAGPFLLI